MSSAHLLSSSLLLLLGNAFFVGAEFALISARRTQIEPRGRGRVRGWPAPRCKAMENISLVIGVNQLGITVCSLLLGAVAEPAVAHLLEPALARAARARRPSSTRSRSRSASPIVVYLHVVLGEMVPKNIALAGPDRAALVLGPPIWAIVTVLRPVIIVINAIARGVLRLVGVELQDEVSSTYTREEVAALVEESRGEGLLEEDEYDRLAGALGFTEKTVADGADAAGHARPPCAAGRPPPTSRRCARPPASAGSRSLGDDGEPAGLPAHQGRARDRRGRAGSGSSTTSGSGRSPRSARPTPLHDALETLQRRGAHLARVVDADGAGARAGDPRGRDRGAGRRDPRRGTPGRARPDGVPRHGPTADRVSARRWHPTTTEECRHGRGGRRDPHAQPRVDRAEPAQLGCGWPGVPVFLWLVLGPEADGWALGAADGLRGHRLPRRLPRPRLNQTSRARPDPRPGRRPALHPGRRGRAWRCARSSRGGSR